jgi:hypothetical protein
MADDSWVIESFDPVSSGSPKVQHVKMTFERPRPEDTEHADLAKDLAALITANESGSPVLGNKARYEAWDQATDRDLAKAHSVMDGFRDKRRKYLESGGNDFDELARIEEQISRATAIHHTLTERSKEIKAVLNSSSRQIDCELLRSIGDAQREMEADLQDEALAAEEALLTAIAEPLQRLLLAKERLGYLAHVASRMRYQVQTRARDYWRTPAA